MRRLGVALTVGGLALGLLAANPAYAQDASWDGPVPVRVRHFEGSVTVQRAQAGETGEALVNLPLDAGDRLWTEDGGRAELVLADGTLVWLDSRTTLDIVSLSRSGTGETILRVWGGSLIAARDDGRDVIRIDLPEASVRLSERTLARVDVEAGRSWVSVMDGYAEIAAGGISELVSAGERSYAETGTAPAEPAVYNTAEQDGFDRWHAQRVADLSRVVEHVRERSYVPREVVHYAADLEPHGSWFYYDEFDTWAWRPQVAVSWAPYRHGRWVYAYGGWTWVAYEPWGWVTGHYGRWHHLPARGWVWFPGQVYSPAWVSWYVGGGYVGWCPVGYYNQPLLSINLWLGGYRGYGSGYHGYGYGHDRYRNAVPRGKVVAGRGYVDGPDSPWTFVGSDDLGRPDGVRRAVDRDAVRRNSGGGAVSLQGALRPRNPAVLTAGSGPRIATPRQDVGAPTPRTTTESQPRVAVGRDAPRPGDDLGRPGPGRTDVAVPRPRGDTDGTVQVQPRPRPGEEPTRIIVPRPRQGENPSPTVLPRPGDDGRRVIVPRPGGDPGRMIVPRPGGDPGRTILPRPRSGDAGTLSPAPSSGGRVVMPRPRSGDDSGGSSWFSRPGGTVVQPRSSFTPPSGSRFQPPSIAPRAVTPRPQLNGSRGPAALPAPRASVPRAPVRRSTVSPRSGSSSGRRPAVRRGGSSSRSGASRPAKPKAKPRKPGSQ